MKKHLEKKGWHPKHIFEAENLLELSQVRKHPDVKRIEKSLFWFTLSTSILGTCLLSIAIIPIFIIANTGWSYFFVALFGFLLGFLISYISRKMHWIEEKHRIMLSAIAPAVGIFCMFVITSLVNSFNVFARLNNYHDPFLISLIYFVSFMTPHLLMEAKKHD